VQPFRPVAGAALGGAGGAGALVGGHDPVLVEQDEQVRHRAKLVALRSGLKAQVHSALSKKGVLLSMSDIFGVDGRNALDVDELASARVITTPKRA
jgi:hypothetical protein